MTLMANLAGCHAAPVASPGAAPAKAGKVAPQPPPTPRFTLQDFGGGEFPTMRVGEYYDFEFAQVVSNFPYHHYVDLTFRLLQPTTDVSLHVPSLATNERDFTYIAVTDEPYETVTWSDQATLAFASFAPQVPASSDVTALIRTVGDENVYKVQFINVFVNGDPTDLATERIVTFR